MSICKKIDVGVVIYFKGVRGRCPNRYVMGPFKMAFSFFGLNFDLPLDP